MSALSELREIVGGERELWSRVQAWEQRWLRLLTFHHRVDDRVFIRSRLDVEAVVGLELAKSIGRVALSEAKITRHSDPMTRETQFDGSVWILRTEPQGSFDRWPAALPCPEEGPR